MSIKQFQTELSKGMPSPVYLLYSSDDFLLYEALASLKGPYSDAAGFNFEVFDVKSSDDVIPVEQIVDILNTMPFLSSRKVVVIHNVQKLAKKDVQKLEAYVQNPADTALLVMLYSGTAPKLFAAAASGGMKTIALTVQERELPQWIKEKARQKKVSLTDNAVEYLIAVTGTDLGLLSAEIEKLACFINDRVIDVDDLRSIVYSGAEYSAFDLIDALKRKDAGEVFRIFESVAKNQEPQMLLGALNYHYGRQLSGPQKGAAGTIRLLHEADIAIKSSHRYVIEELLVKLLKK
ncbi:MAG: DNA polymerase III subunit delta [Nitrospirae bacterium]|nr:DNA polymerase III subunit delta [Nitrospirota bacterium]